MKWPSAQDGARPHRAVPQGNRQARQRHLLVVRPRSYEHLFKSCKKWKSQQAILWAEVRRKTKKREGQIQTSELFVEEKCSPAMLDFLRSTSVGMQDRTGEDERRIRTSSGAVAFCVVAFAFTVWRNNWERRKPRRTGHFSVWLGQDKECVLKLMTERGRIQNDLFNHTRIQSI